MNKRFLFGLIMAFLAVSCICHKVNARCNPVANPAAVVISDNARFTVLTPEIIRIE